MMLLLDVKCIVQVHLNVQVAKVSSFRQNAFLSCTQLKYLLTRMVFALF